MLDSGAVGPGFKSQPRRLSGNSLRQTVHTHRASVHQAAKLIAALSRVAWVTAGLAKSNAAFMTHITGRLTAKNRDQLRNPTLGSRVWATFTFFVVNVSVTFRMFRCFGFVVGIRFVVDLLRICCGFDVASKSTTN